MLICRIMSNPSWFPSNFPRSSSSPPSSRTQLLRPRGPFWSRHRSPDVSLMNALCYFSCWFIFHKSSEFSICPFCEHVSICIFRCRFFPQTYCVLSSFKVSSFIFWSNSLYFPSCCDCRIGGWVLLMCCIIVVCFASELWKVL